MRRAALHVVVYVTLAVAWGNEARAERNESTVGIMGGVLLPAFTAPQATAFTLATWSAAVEGQYGVTDNIYLRGSFTFSSFSGKAQPPDGVATNGRSYDGVMAFRGMYYHPELGARFKILGGYNLAPYLEANLGYLWGVFDKATVTTNRGGTVPFPDFAQGAFTAGAGAAVDYRLFDTMFAGLAVRYVRTLGTTLARQYISVPVTISYYW